MLHNLLLEGSLGHRLAAGQLYGALARLQCAIASHPALGDARRAFSTAYAAPNDAADEAMTCHRSADDGASPVGTSGACGLASARQQSLATFLAGPLLHQGLETPLLLQRSISTSANASANFDSNLTRYPKAKVTSRDNYKRWRDSGRDVRVAANILAEGGGEGRGSGRGGGGGGRGGKGMSPMDELKAVILECKDLRELQIVVRECGCDMDASLTSIAMIRLPKLKQATPAAASPAALSQRVAERLMLRMQDLINDFMWGQLAGALNGVAECGVLPGRPLLEAVTLRATSRAPRGHAALIEANAQAVSLLMLSLSKFMTIQKQQQQKQSGPTLQQPALEATGGSVGASAEGVAAEQQQQQPVRQLGDDVLRDQLWPSVRLAAEVKLRRALGEEPAGAAAVPVGSEDGPQVDDSMPQIALRVICKALAIAREADPRVWAPALQLSARHAAELQPAVAASVLRSYAMAGGPALDGGREGLLAAVWGALGPRVADLEVSVVLDLAIAASKIAASSDGGDGSRDAAMSMLRTNLDVLTPRLPAVSCSELGVLLTCTSAAHRAMSTASTAGAGVGAAPSPEAEPPAPPPPPLPSPAALYGAFPRLVGDMLLLRGPKEFGPHNFAAISLGLALLGVGDRALWQAVEKAAAPEVPKMDGRALSRLLGALHSGASSVAFQEVTAGAAAAAAEAPAGPRAPPPFTAAVHPEPATIEATYMRLNALLDAPCTSSGLGGKEAMHVLRCLVDWPLPEGGQGSAVNTFRALADRLAETEGGPGGVLETTYPGVRQRIASGLQAVGLGDHPLVALLTHGSS